MLIGYALNNSLDLVELLKVFQVNLLVPNRPFERVIFQAQ